MAKNTLSVMEQKLSQYVSRLYYTLKSLGDTEKVVSWKTEDLQLKNVLLLPLPITFFPSIRCYQNSNFCLISKATRLNKKNTTFPPSNIITYFYIYELEKWLRELNFDFN